MGSTGSGNFSDYQGYKGKSKSNKGGSSGEDKCGKAFSTNLEEVQTCEYYINNNNVPVEGTQVRVVFNSPRLAVINMHDICIGYLPTKYNYIKFCLENNFNYGGIVVNSALTPIPSVVVDIQPV